jgi:4-amino-4-deoxy-L-arabinose transferase-like glycosyltransferase
VTSPTHNLIERRPALVAALLLAAALILHLSGLGLEPLRDFDEGTVAQVAREIAARGWGGLWHPTLWGEPYVNKPPLVHGLVALSMRAFGEESWAIRLPPAILSAASVPAFFLLAREVFGRPRPALWSGLVFVTLLPVTRHGRLAMLDGALVLWGLLFLWSLLRARGGGAWPLAAGLALSAALLTKGAAAGVFGLLGLALLLQLAPALLRNPLLWALGLLGLLPAGAWYAVQVGSGGGAYAEAALANQVLVRLAPGPDGNTGGPGYYLIELLEGTLPWLLFLPLGLRLAWRERREPWAALALPWFAGYLALITLLPGKLPWYIHPLLPAVALLCGRAIEGPVFADGRRGLPVLRFGLGSLAVLAVAGAVLLGPASADPSLLLSLGLLALAASLAFGAFVLGPNDARAPLALAIGAAAAVLCLSLSGRSVWELNEAFPVGPVAAMVRDSVPKDAAVLTTHPYRRPSLDFYAERPIRPGPAEALDLPEMADAHWLVTEREALAIQDRDELGSAAGQVLLAPRR